MSIESYTVGDAVEPTNLMSTTLTDSHYFIAQVLAGAKTGSFYLKDQKGSLVMSPRNSKEPAVFHRSAFVKSGVAVVYHLKEGKW